MVLVYMLTWLGYIDGIHVTIYSSTMDPSWDYSTCCISIYELAPKIPMNFLGPVRFLDFLEGSTLYWGKCQVATCGHGLFWRSMLMSFLSDLRKRQSSIFGKSDTWPWINTYKYYIYIYVKEIFRAMFRIFLGGWTSITTSRFFLWTGLHGPWPIPKCWKLLVV
jgi:hypothetical protein